jgi:ATP-binding cassette subfamily B protein
MFKNYATILPYLRKYRRNYVLGLFCLVVVDAAQLLIPQLIRKAIDLVSSGAFPMSSILGISLSMVGIAACISAGRFLWRFFIHGSSRRIENEMRDRLFDHLLELSGGFFQSNKTGDIMARATNDIGAIRQATGMGFVTFVDGSFMSIAILAIMIAQNPGTALLTIIPLPVITVLMIFFGRLVGKRFERVQAIYSRLSEIAQETMAGLRVVKAFVKEEKFAGDFSVSNDQYRDASMGLVKIFGLFFPLISFLSGLTTLILLSAGGNAVIQNRMSPGDIVAMLAYLQMLVWPMIGAGFTVNTLQRGAASLGRVNQVLDAVPDIVSSPGASAEIPEGRLEFLSLSFTYPGAATPALEGLSFALERGSTLGILGRVGSGKSTLLRLLPRLMDPPRGSIFVGGRDVHDYELASLRSAFGFVPQDSFLFSDTIEANIRFGAPDMDTERFLKVAAIAAIDRDVADFPEGWNTVVGEKGLTLSGGQKQRIAIARALALDPEILVLDDSLSAVDAETEDRILASLIGERRGRTNIIVSHRVSTLRNADLILVLDRGRVTQRGDHEALLAETTGFYAEIARLQELERVVERGV